MSSGSLEDSGSSEIGDFRNYTERLEEETEEAYSFAEKARGQEKDPESHVDIPVAEDLAAKSVGLVTADQFPELEDTGLEERIRELEEDYGKNDERVALEIGKEIAEKKFHEFEDLEDAVDAGLRIGLAYMTGGIVTAPLEGVAEVEIRNNDDGSEYLAVHYSGPIRSAGGTASAMSVLLADYIRKEVGLSSYDPREEEVERYATEVEDYFKRVTKKQYTPERDETRMISENVPVEITGTPTEQKEVSNYKDLERVHTNRIRGGMCLVYLDGLPLKASKLQRRIDSFGEEFGLEHWGWIEDYLDLQHEIHASEEQDEDEGETGYEPSDKYLGSLTAGRPVFSHPGREGGFRLRYGRSRNAGLAAVSVHPATMEITEGFIAIGTQLKTEYPGKATVAMPCDSIEPPVVRKLDGDVVRPETRQEAAELSGDIDEILFMGDVLVPYGEFLENGKDLLPSPYVREWWVQDLEERLKEEEREDFREYTDEDVAPNVRTALLISEELDIPLHPEHSLFWGNLEMKEFSPLYSALEETDGNVLPDEKGVKEALESLYVVHEVTEEGLEIPEDRRVLLDELLEPGDSSIEDFEPGIREGVGEVSGVEVRDQAPIFLGNRMGRPEKAERRTLKGKPQLLFPCGRKEGGRMRNLSSTYEKGSVESEVLANHCTECNEVVPFSYCPYCGGETRPLRKCQKCGTETMEEAHCGMETERSWERDIDVEGLMDIALENVDMKLPELLKSPRSVTGKNKHVEPLEKGLLRKKHDLYVNKDGTVRYDATDVPLTHFRPREVSVSVDKLKELGYETDIDGEELEDEDQLLELKYQDIVIPDNDAEMPASEYMLRTANFVDDLLEEFYGLPRYYEAEEKEGLVGELVVGLAPHTSGGMVGRIIGFSEAKGVYAHPFWHAAKRRNADGDEDSIILLMDALLNFSRQFLPDQRGTRSVTKDTRVFVRQDGEIKAPKFSDLVNRIMERKGYEVRDDGFEVCRDFTENIEAISFDDDGAVTFQPVSALIRHENDKRVYEVKTSRGEISVTEDHSVFVTDGGGVEAKPARELEVGDAVVVPSNPEVEADGLPSKIDLFELLPDDECYVEVPDSEHSDLAPEIEERLTSEITADWGEKNIYRYLTGRRAAPLTFYREVGVTPSCKVRVKHDSPPVKRYVEEKEEIYRLLGYLMSEGELSTGEIHNTDRELIDDAVECIESLTEASPQVLTDNREGRNQCFSTRVPRTFMKALEELGLEIESATQKGIPSFLFGADKTYVEAFIEAYRAGDGTVYDEKGFSKLYTASGEMASQLALLLRKIGFKTSAHQAGDTWEVLYSEWGDKDPYWPLWGVLGEVRERLRDSGHGRADIKRRLSNYRRNDRMKTASKMKVEDLYEEGVESLSRPVEGDIAVERVKEVEEIEYGDEYVYDFEVPGAQNFLCGPHPIFAHNTMDAPLILSTVLHPDEVDDESWNVDVAERYSKDFYEATQRMEGPGEVDVPIAEDLLEEEEGFSFTHGTENLEDAPVESSYVSLGKMAEKVREQLSLGERIVAVDEDNVAELLLDKHFLPDIKGNLRSFSEQQFRCVDCNDKYRRAPLKGRCKNCGGKLLLTISEGTIRKYLVHSEEIADSFAISPYLRQQIMILKRNIESLFGKDDRQSSLGRFVSE
ncbi:MAG: DNA polymerase II large subunit [Candidatus Nanohaloarchaeota archaeon QJJ-7]|nr:DNA polymerase II large subunit [Candidatus Nanohaloarchaeota archaeon QJJ-7]